MTCNYKLTKYSSDCIPSIALEVKKGWNSNNHLIEKTSKGPQVALAAVFLFEEKLRWGVFESAKEGSF